MFVTRRLGRVVICGATSGYKLVFDARYLWMHQKSIVGSHGCNQHDATRACHLVDKGTIKPTLTRTFAFAECAQAHQVLFEDRSSMGSFAITVD